MKNPENTRKIILHQKKEIGMNDLKTIPKITKINTKKVTIKAQPVRFILQSQSFITFQSCLIKSNNYDILER